MSRARDRRRKKARKVKAETPPPAPRGEQVRHQVTVPTPPAPYVWQGDVLVSNYGPRWIPPKAIAMLVPVREGSKATKLVPV